VRPARRANNSAFLVVPNVKIRMEAQHSIPPLSLHDLLREMFTFYDILCKNMAEPYRPQMTVQISRILFACWITKATYTHSEYGIYIAFPRRQWLHKRALMPLCTYMTSLVIRIISSACLLSQAL
jgi:hypothetical protein